MAKLTNKHQLPPQIEAYAKRNAYSKGDADFSATELLLPPRQRVLRQKFEDHLEHDVMDNVWALFGKAVHDMLDKKANYNHQAEQRLFHEYNGVKVSGQIDVQSIQSNGDVWIEDWKVTKAYTYMRYKRHEARAFEEQLNIYAQLMRDEKGIEPKKLRIWMIIKDYSENMKNPDYPPAPICYLDMPVWPEEKTLRFISDRIALHKKAEMDAKLGDIPPLCTDEERWKRPDKWEVYRNPDNRRPVKTCDSADEALEKIEEIKDTAKNPCSPFVRHVPGEYVKCAKYCEVREFCPGGKSEPEPVPEFDDDTWSPDSLQSAIDGVSEGDLDDWD